ncbi:hypothetical protein GCM10011519_08000 [Marmoricola endophyticus]|uniref:Nudix hydrolase domain-containing protein n=1 Tax=Marmoricola endophyticus TaxID=2040280 RepID=A0A917F1Z7_9ACTN|nr:NUDIX domain-containing protein [Marmoricola endophyticus]GGF36863.1 hypothetical protein GCM10011519_08000 [Marmoricola endophyticus]
MSAALPDYTEYDTRLAAYAIVSRGEGEDRQVLLALWNEPDRPRWTLPGGGVELAESVEEGVVREVREETGYVVVVDRLLGIGTATFSAARRMRDTDRPMKAVRVFYAVSIVGGALAAEVDGTTDEARWFTLDEVADLPRTGQVDEAIALWRQAR